MSKNSVSRNGLGIGNALLSGITWGLDTVLIGIILAMTPFVATDRAILMAPFISTFFHDSFSAIWITLYHIFKGEFGQVIKSIKTKSGLFIMLGALLGGPIGMTCYMLSVKYIGASYAAAITSMYPAIGAFFAFVFLKEKHPRRVWMGILMSVTGVIIIGFQPSSASEGSNFLLGILFSLGTVLGWGLESVVCAYGMKEDVTAEHALNIRQLTSGIFYGVIILPFIGGHFMTGSLLTDKVSLLIAATALVGTTSYVLYYKAISTIGAAKSTSLNITYAIWAIVIQVIFFNSSVTLQLVGGSLVTILGAVLVAGNPKEFLRAEAVNS